MLKITFGCVKKVVDFQEKLMGTNMMENENNRINIKLIQGIIVSDMFILVNTVFKFVTKAHSEMH